VVDAEPNGGASDMWGPDHAGPGTILKQNSRTER
jgi:hypothetical protein